MDLISTFLLHFLLLACSLPPGAVSLRTALRKSGKARSVRPEPGCPEHPGPGLWWGSQSRQLHTALSADRRRGLSPPWLCAELNRGTSLALPQPRQFQGCCLLKETICFPELAEVVGSVQNHRLLKVGGSYRSVSVTED